MYHNISSTTCFRCLCNGKSEKLNLCAELCFRSFKSPGDGSEFSEPSGWLVMHLNSRCLMAGQRVFFSFPQNKMSPFWGGFDEHYEIYIEIQGYQSRVPGIRL